MSAFYAWKIDIGYEMSYDHVLRNRALSLNMVTSIMQKNLNIISKLAFWQIKEMSDGVKKNSAKKIKGSFVSSNNSPFYKSIIIPRLD